MMMVKLNHVSENLKTESLSDISIFSTPVEAEP